MPCVPEMSWSETRLEAGLLENDGLSSFLPGLSRHVLGEDLSLPGVATWWCGQESEKDHVLEKYA